MNFTYLNNFPKLNKLSEYCKEAEDFVISNPSISATCARRAMEYIVKMIYSSIVADDSGLTVFEMVTDSSFIEYIDDSTLINTIHYIRKMGNVAVHDGGLTQDESKKILEELHFLEYLKSY